jgi:Inorganic pyrophosphatase
MAISIPAPPQRPPVFRKIRDSRPCPIYREPFSKPGFEWASSPHQPLSRQHGEVGETLVNRRTQSVARTRPGSRSPFEGDLQDIRRLPSRAIKELEKFFEATNALEAKTLKFLGWRGPAKAIKTIKKSSL